MKKINKFLLIITLLMSVITQSQTIKDINAFPWAEPGVYYKDLNNVLDPFVGTYTMTRQQTQVLKSFCKKKHNQA